MTTSLPSKEIHSLDVPEPTDLTVEFVYNFFVASEGAQEIDDTTAPFDALEVDGVDRSIAFNNNRVSRYNTLKWSMPTGVSTVQLPAGVLTANINKVVNENDLSTDNFFSILFSDPDLAFKMQGFISSSLTLQTVGSSDAGKSGRKYARQSADLVTSTSGFNIVTAGLQQLQGQFGVTFFDKNGVTVHDTTWDAMTQLGMLLQMNSKLAQGLIQNCVADPHSPYTTELTALQATTAKLANMMKQKPINGLSETDFRSYVPYIDIKTGTTSLSNLQAANIVGYIIDKVEYLPDGTTNQHPPLIIEDPSARFAIDVRTKYGSTYAYVVRAIAQIASPAIDDSNGDVALITFLVSSRPSVKEVVRCIELTPPPVPNDINFTWDYENDQLQVHWTNPVNSQRDIKQYQVFRRNSIKEPFQLIKNFSFNDAQVQNDQTVHFSEFDIDQSLVEFTSSPRCYYIDPDFNKQSSYIYTVASIDAHGLCSNYGAQFKLGFDVFKNKLTKELVSHSGAPKPYPNMYLNMDLFKDILKASGPAAKKLRVYLNPEFYSVVDNNGKSVDVLSTIQTNGTYVLQLINTDLQKMTRIDISIDDQNKARQKGTAS